MTHKTHKFWLKVTAISIITYAVLFFLGTVHQTDKAIEVVLDISSWPIDELQNYDAKSTVFLSALLGGILFGWGILIWFLSSKIYDIAPEQTRKIVLISLVCWFVIDGLGSIFSGNSNNVIANIFLILVLVGPLWTPVKE
ncbi:hypothetical protein [Maribacter sp. 4G9]|uniref:hypothetical protein n=1 Tax=Maribacter sp. 4G9 TaxID=1889777 RepID=UPI000C14B1B2|nr:hypothetical protein [Maribacter sp. 4G9]PIB38284.1 hypothetical protein BFP75_17000 [Maribacter sp. 4G9]